MKRGGTVQLLTGPHCAKVMIDSCSLPAMYLLVCKTLPRQLSAAYNQGTLRLIPLIHI